MNQNIVGAILGISTAVAALTTDNGHALAFTWKCIINWFGG